MKVAPPVALELYLETTRHCLLEGSDRLTLQMAVDLGIMAMRRLVDMQRWYGPQELGFLLDTWFGVTERLRNLTHNRGVANADVLLMTRQSALQALEETDTSNWEIRLRRIARDVFDTSREALRAYNGGK